MKIKYKTTTYGIFGGLKNASANNNNPLIDMRMNGINALNLLSIFSTEKRNFGFSK
jgi:hypothetical protein